MLAFRPHTATVTIAASTSSASGTVSAANVQGSDLYILNASTGVAFVRVGKGTQTAVLTDYPVAVGAALVVNFGETGFTDVGVILASGTGNVYACKGRGI